MRTLFAAFQRFCPECKTFLVNYVRGEVLALALLVVRPAQASSSDQAPDAHSLLRFLQIFFPFKSYLFRISVDRLWKLRKQR